ncbi:MAG: hypothetical protein JWO36_3081 [Myxococcales bacterium]|nr:hypothetical protein [Myxococcales bacterium]
MRVFVLASLLWLVPQFASADNGRLLSDDTFAVQKGGDLVLDAGLFAGFPSALATGMSTGVGAGITRMCGCHFAYGARASWSTVTESNDAWIISQGDLRLRAIGAVRHTAGRGTLSLRLGVGATVVHETRDHVQGMFGNNTQTSVFSTLPAADLDAVIGLHVAGPWLLVVSGGPSVDYFSGGLRGGWSAQLGVAWQP